MKAIRIFEDRIEVAGMELPRLRLYADSAIGRDVMPLFVPDLPGGWRARICVAVRVNRLGKDIAAKFALRYVDAISLVALMLPSDGEREWDACGALAIMDSAVTTGRWLACDVAATRGIDVDIDGRRLSFPTDALGIAAKVSEVSRMAILRTGDLIVIDSTGTDVPLLPDRQIRASIGGETCLAIKVK